MCTYTYFHIGSCSLSNRKIKTLGDDEDDDDDAHAWIEKSRKKQQEKEKAERKVGNFQCKSDSHFII